MKKLFLSFLLILMLVISATACGGSDGAGGGTESGGGSESGGGLESGGSETKNYSITWIDENGTEIGKTTVAENSAPSKEYSVSDTDEWDYTFEGWSLSQGGEVLSTIPTATENTTYYAVVTKTKRVYTVSFNTNGGSAVTSQSIEYGSVAALPSEPTYEGFRFMGWFADAENEAPVDWSLPITGNVTYYAAWNELVDIGAFLEALLSGYTFNPYSYIPEAMTPSYSANLISESDVITDYTDFVNISDIPSHGFGEQWNMILKNVEQSAIFFNVLSVVETVSAASVTAFNNYLDENAADTADYTFNEGIYTITITFNGEIIAYVVDYTATIPALGEQTVQIALAMDVDTGEKSGRVQIGDANALKYTVKENSYEFAIKYLGVRRAYFSIERNSSGNIEGHIYEILTVSSTEIKSAADFYITDNYVTAVGNKADGLIGFTGYISETYNKSNGRLIGYEVQETLSAITYNTLWFDLDCFDGLESIKYIPAENETPAKFFVNGQSSAWSAKKVGGLGLKMMSRRFDIEFRTQYFYSYDSESEKYIEIKAEVPMLFIQEENYDTFASDVYSENSVTLELTVADAQLQKLLSDYDTKIEPFIAAKEAVTAETIVEYIGTKITHQ